MCNCIELIKKEIEQEYAEKFNSDVRVRAMGWDKMEFGIRWIVVRKNYDGSKEAGWSKTARYTGRNFKYCPFCGEKKTT